MRTVILACIVALSTARLGLAQLRVQPDSNNVVASRLVGRWEVDTTQTLRLWGNRSILTEVPPVVAFTSDTTIAARFPARFGQALAGKRVYLAGVLTFGTTTYPYILIENAGNPHVIYLQPRGADPYGDSESFNVMLGRATSPANDLFLMGGDFNNQPFIVLRRVAP